MEIGALATDAPLLDELPTGQVLLATPFDNPFNSLVAVYIAASVRRAAAELPGQVSTNVDMGQITSTFDNNPQLPFSRLHRGNIGDVTVGAGAGSCPFYITNGRAYFATVTVRATVFVDKHTTNVRVASDPFPTILQGIPLKPTMGLRADLRNCAHRDQTPPFSPDTVQCAGDAAVDDQRTAGRRQRRVHPCGVRGHRRVCALIAGQRVLRQERASDPGSVRGVAWPGRLRPDRSGHHPGRKAIGDDDYIGQNGKVLQVR